MANWATALPPTATHPCRSSPAASRPLPAASAAACLSSPTAASGAWATASTTSWAPVSPTPTISAPSRSSREPPSSRSPARSTGCRAITTSPTAQVAQAGSLAGTNVPLYAPTTVTPDGSGGYNFSSTLTVPASQNSDGSYSTPQVQNGTVIIPYDDGDRTSTR